MNLTLLSLLIISWIAHLQTYLKMKRKVDVLESKEIQKLKDDLRSEAVDRMLRDFYEKHGTKESWGRRGPRQS